MNRRVDTGILTECALTFAAEHFGVRLSELSVQVVKGGYSLNRRAIVEADNRFIFVKEVDVSLLEGDGQEERAWLAKDHELTSILRNESIPVVASWSKLSSDRTVLLLPAYRPQEGWTWSLPVEEGAVTGYITAVLGAAKLLEKATFNAAQIEKLSLRPYFRDKLAEDASLLVLEDTSNQRRLLQKCAALLDDTETKHLASELAALRRLITDKVARKQLKQVGEQLAGQPNDAFGHCDLRTDNLTYNSGTGELVLVDWNWASFVPSGFGATEFLISVARHSTDVSQWYNRLNRPLLAAVVGFWLKGCLEPDLDETSKLRDHQLLSAAVAYGLLQNTA